MGHTITAVELGGNSNQLQAAATGDVDITALAQIMDAIDQGWISASSRQPTPTSS